METLINNDSCPLKDGIRRLVGLSGLTSLLLASIGGLNAADSIRTLEGMIGGLRPGVTVQVADGDYQTLQPILIEGKRGTDKAPIVVRAEHRGCAVIGGVAGFVIRDCEYLVLEGFTFTNDTDQPAVLLDNSRHVQVTRNSFHLSSRARQRHVEHWVYVVGTNSAENRIDHNLFEHKVNFGSFVFVRGDDTALVCSRHDRIDHNCFRDIAYGGGPKGHETIRTGGNDLGASGQSSFTIIEENLLEHCSGEQEIMSLKSSDNIVRNNTLLNCRGAICLRLGNRDVVSGNFVITTDGGSGQGGVKLYGCDHRVFNNYFAGLTGMDHEAPLAMIPGTLDTPVTQNIGKKYDTNTTVPATRAWIAFNTWVDCAPLQFGLRKVDRARKYVPNECVFVNNLVVCSGAKCGSLVNLEPVRSLKAHDNLGYATGMLSRAEWAGWFHWEDPRLRQDEQGLWRLRASSPAAGMAVETSEAITNDVFGRARVGRSTVGAEEFSRDVVLQAPLTPDKVGPDAP